MTETLLRVIGSHEWTGLEVLALGAVGLLVACLLTDAACAGLDRIQARWRRRQIRQLLNHQGGSYRDPARPLESRASGPAHLRGLERRTGHVSTATAGVRRGGDDSRQTPRASEPPRRAINGSAPAVLDQVAGYGETVTLIRATPTQRVTPWMLGDEQ